MFLLNLINKQKLFREYSNGKVTFIEYRKRHVSVKVITFLNT